MTSTPKCNFNVDYSFKCVHIFCLAAKSQVKLVKINKACKYNVFFSWHCQMEFTNLSTKEKQSFLQILHQITTCTKTTSYFLFATDTYQTLHYRHIPGLVLLPDSQAFLLQLRNVQYPEIKNIWLQSNNII